MNPDPPSKMWLIWIPESREQNIECLSIKFSWIEKGTKTDPLSNGEQKKGGFIYI